MNGAPPVNLPHILIYLNSTRDDNEGGARDNRSPPAPTRLYATVTIQEHTQHCSSLFLMLPFSASICQSPHTLDTRAAGWRDGGRGKTIMLYVINPHAVIRRLFSGNSLSVCKCG